MLYTMTIVIYAFKILSLTSIRTFSPTIVIKKISISLLLLYFHILHKLPQYGLDFVIVPIRDVRVIS